MQCQRIIRPLDDQEDTALDPDSNTNSNTTDTAFLVEDVLSDTDDRQ